MMRAALFTLTSVATVATGGCGPKGITIIEPPTKAVVFYGKVANVTGEPIAGAVIHGQHFPNSCGKVPVEDSSATTGASGLYRYPFVVTSSTTGCVKLVFSANGFSPESTVVSAVFKAGMQVDSMEVNALLRTS